MKIAVIMRIQVVAQSGIATLVENYSVNGGDEIKSQEELDALLLSVAKQAPALSGYDKLREMASAVVSEPDPEDEGL